MLSAAFVYELPVGQGRKYLNQRGVANVLARRLADEHDLQVLVRPADVFPRRASATCRARSAPDAFPRSPTPGRCSRRTRAASTRRKGPLFNKNAFEPVSAFNFYYGQGNRIEESVRAFGYHNQDLSFIKNTRMAGSTNLQIRFEIFNLWNWHMFSNPGQFGGLAFNNDLASPDFGKWNGSVTEPRTMQLAARIEF